MNTPNTEVPFKFNCGGDQLVGMVHTGDCVTSTGVIIVVGGGQYRVGAHRQFVLLARFLGENGIPVFRFDLRGMGDSTGRRSPFTELDEEIRSAIECFLDNNSQLEEVILWGLCDGASASILYAVKDSRVKGVVMVNPWITTERGAANTQLKHYYLARIFKKSFWSAVVRGHISIINSLKYLIKTVITSIKRESDITEQAPLPRRVLGCIDYFKGHVLIILSGNDLTAREFEDAIAKDKRYNHFSDNTRVSVTKHEKADHTFSSENWRNQLQEWTKKWIQELEY